ncbi:NAD(P)-binding protein [Didymella exigua CBS 183.55]|uniref:NAD(P)-binding protein n=1 Tax=Didymella exigua CBS 183.55 TaxID=1150837 RepID=A0A6A5S4S5_9PLEO|nr:NAD(P)-binding protein [Didymella exigua CBS 183.55]KAF1933486.1 NAD(P)-binding protein [Didymella exigua CBS 183.55]
MTRTLLLFGAGPGIGDNVAAAFASAGIEHIVLLGRNTERLQNQDAPFVQKAASNVKVDTLRADLSDLNSIPQVLKDLDDLTEGEDVEVVYYNAARIKPTDPVLGVVVKEIDEDFRTQVLGLHMIAQHYIPRLQATAKSNAALKPALLVTNSHLPWDPVPQLISLSLVKGAQRTHVLSLSRAFGGTGVHCGLVNVQGVVDPGNKVLSPENIAKEVVRFWRRAEGVEVNLKEE